MESKQFPCSINESNIAHLRMTGAQFEYNKGIGTSSVGLCTAFKIELPVE